MLAPSSKVALLPKPTAPVSVEIPDTFNAPVSTVAVSTPTLVKFAPSPVNDVAVITPAFPILILLPTSNCPFTSTTLLNVAAVPVIILSVDATPISPEPVSYTHLTLPTILLV